MITICGAISQCDFRECLVDSPLTVCCVVIGDVCQPCSHAAAGPLL